MLADALALANLEKETLQTIARIGLFEQMGSISDNASRCINKIHGGAVNANLSFEIDIGLRGDRGQQVKRRIDIAAQVVAITPANPRTHSASYSVIFCNGLTPSNSTVLRKFHFDYETVEFRNHAEPKPTSHLQICGKLSRYHTDAGYTDQHIEVWIPSLEKPRIPVQPTSLALLVNWILIECSTDRNAARILKDDEWRSLVRKAERKILLPYYKSAAEFLELQRNADISFYDRQLYERS